MPLLLLLRRGVVDGHGLLRESLLGLHATVIGVRLLGGVKLAWAGLELRSAGGDLGIRNAGRGGGVALLEADEGHD